MPLLVEITQLRALVTLAVVLWIVDALLRRRDMRRRREAALPLAASGGSIALALWGVPFAQYALFALAAIGGTRALSAIARLDPRTMRGRSIRVILQTVALLCLMTIAAQPVCHRTEYTWQRPLLAVLLDHSGSMDVRDPNPAGGALPRRSERVAAALRRSGSTIDALRERFELRVLRFSTSLEAADDWNLDAPAGLTGLASAIQAAAGLRSSALESPAAVLMISDGAETVADAGAVKAAARALAAQRSALLIAGCGPVDDTSPMIEFDPLVTPPSVRVRDTLHLTVAFEAIGCRDHELRLEMLWNDEPADSAAIGITRNRMHVEHGFVLVPPGPGAHRLTARVTLPAALGSVAFLESTVLDVTDEQIRVLIVDRAPQTESAFIARALSGDERFSVTRRFLFDPRGASAIDALGPAEWAGFDVIIVGRVGDDLPLAALDGLAQDVERRRVGLALTGGRELLGSARYAESALVALSPTALVAGRPAGDEAVVFEPTADGKRHPALAGLDAWSELPPLAVAGALGPAKPAASVLAARPDGAPLLAVQSYGGGRVLAAAWESTWPWSLASDTGLATHKRLWRQLVAWLANRQPRAWILTDQSEYALAALVSPDRKARISAGVSGGDDASAARAQKAEIAVRRVDDVDNAWLPLAARATDHGWQAEWPPSSPAGQVPVAAGNYEFRVSVAGDGEPNALGARTRISVVADDLERRPPTANLTLLRDLGGQGAPGSAYADIDALDKLLDPLTAEDRRRRVANVRRDELVATHAWPLALLAVGSLAIDWIIRRRIGQR